MQHPDLVLYLLGLGIGQKLIRNPSEISTGQANHPTFTMVVPVVPTMLSESRQKVNGNPIMGFYSRATSATWKSYCRHQTTGNLCFLSASYPSFIFYSFILYSLHLALRTLVDHYGSKKRPLLEHILQLVNSF